MSYLFFLNEAYNKHNSLYVFMHCQHFNPFSDKIMFNIWVSRPKNIINFTCHFRTMTIHWCTLFFNYVMLCKVSSITIIKACVKCLLSLLFQSADWLLGGWCTRQPIDWLLGELGSPSSLPVIPSLALSCALASRQVWGVSRSKGTQFNTHFFRNLLPCF